LRNSQRITGAQLCDPSAVLLQGADLRTQLPVDLGGCGSERLRVGVEQLADPGQRNAGLGQGPLAVPASVFNNVDRIRTTVVLPAPLEPRRAKMLPRATSKSTPRSTRSAL
jgi:hypothetical protein